jgi:hypothetical protein
MSLVRVSKVAKVEGCNLYKMVPTEDGLGRRSEHYATRSGTVELWIDTEALVEDLGRKALYNKQGRSHGCHGAVMVKVLHSEDVTHG